MITLTYIHNHECSFAGEEVVIHPDVTLGAYFRAIPICVETKNELMLIGEGERMADKPAPTFTEDLRHVLNKHGWDAKTNIADNQLAAIVAYFLRTLQSPTAPDNAVDGAIDDPDVLKDLDAKMRKHPWEDH